jgi:hypothetical protein
LEMHAIREIEKKLDGLWIFWGLKWMPCFRVNNSESTCLKLLRIRINYTGGFRYICPTSAWIWYLPCKCMNMISALHYCSSILSQGLGDDILYNLILLY